MSSKQSKVGFDLLEVGELGNRYIFPSKSGKKNQILALVNSKELAWQSLDLFDKEIVNKAKAEIKKQLDVFILDAVTEMMIKAKQEIKEAQEKKIYTGRVNFVNGDAGIKKITFPPFKSEQYTISAIIRYDSKNNSRQPFFFNIAITNKTKSGFSVVTDKPVKIRAGESYWLEWMVLEDN